MGQFLSLLALAAAAAPFAFGVIRAITTGSDFRYLWVALASAVGTAVVMMAGTGNVGKPRGALALSLAVFVVATGAAVLAARLLGTRIGPGMLVVASSFGLCFASGAGLRRLSRLPIS